MIEQSLPLIKKNAKAKWMNTSDWKTVAEEVALEEKTKKKL